MTKESTFSLNKIFSIKYTNEINLYENIIST